MFFKLVLDITTHGIKKSSYKLRTLILREIFQISKLHNNCALINCEVTVAFLCTKLFEKYPSFKEISSCSSGCPKREKTLSIVQVELGLLQRREFDQIESEIIIQGTRPCCQKDCNDFETTVISYSGNKNELICKFYLCVYIYQLYFLIKYMIKFTGNFIIFELYSENTEEQQILLSELPTELNISFVEMYIL